METDEAVTETVTGIATEERDVTMTVEKDAVMTVEKDAVRNAEKNVGRSAGKDVRMMTVAAEIIVNPAENVKEENLV